MHLDDRRLQHADFGGPASFLSSRLFRARQCWLIDPIVGIVARWHQARAYKDMTALLSVFQAYVATAPLRLFASLLL
jgi:hypothetical protein